MKHLRSIIFLLGAALLLGACGDSDGELADSEAFADQEVITAYVDQVILPTYTTLDDRAAELVDAVEAFESDPTDANLEAAREAWIATRLPWEQSEAALFGPVDSNGYDPALDSWPVNQNDLDAVLDSDDELTQEYVRGLDAGLKGFHTIEYLLFGDGGAKTADDFTEREFAYLVASTRELARITGDLEASWTTGVDGNAPYAETFETAGAEGNTAFPTEAAAGEQIISGMVVIADEVANGKVADPYNEQDTTLVESQFSYNSLTDFKNNIRGIRNAYTGEMPAAQTNGKGISEFVREKDSALDERVRSEIDQAISALEDIPEPFRDSITDDNARPKIQEAIDAINTLRMTLEQDVRPVVAGTN